MRMAKIAGIKTVPFALIKENDELAYITTRIDRSRPGEETVKFAMEDFCQLAGKMTFDKYKGSYELCARIVKSFSSQKGLDLSEIFIRVVFSYIVGNSDMHLKNFSLIEREPSGRDFMLSPAYDILPVNVILPDDKDETALAVNGKKRNLRRKDFTAFAESCDLNKKTADKIIDKLCSYRDKYIDECNNSLLPDDLIEKETKLKYDRTKELLDAVDLAWEHMYIAGDLSVKSFGADLLVKTGEIIGCITGGKYTGLSRDAQGNLFLYESGRNTSIESVSRGTMEQVYLALRIAASELLSPSVDLPFILDDTFAYYDEERMKNALAYLKNCKHQVILLTCHSRESRILKEI